MAVSKIVRNRSASRNTPHKLLFIDVKRAYVYADVVEPTFVKLPEEDSEPGMVGRLNKAMHGTRAAAVSWERTYRQHLEEIGFRCGASSPCTFYNESRDLRLVVHGDDYTILGPDNELTWFTKQMQARYEIKVRGKLGPDPNDDRSIRILNRCVAWNKEGI